MSLVFDIFELLCRKVGAMIVHLFNVTVYYKKTIETRLLLLCRIVSLSRILTSPDAVTNERAKAISDIMMSDKRVQHRLRPHRMDIRSIAIV